MAVRLLDSIDSPAALKVLTNEELGILAAEIRDEIVSVTSQTGGHVASSLGAVEIILALHSLLDCPKDRIVFDVGHQAYAHMLVTGRRKEFSTLRQYKGLSGFPKPNTSPYDVHFSGHASDSISVALGLARARDLAGEKYRVVSVIGDASLSGGMAFEALNDIAQSRTPLVIVLNDNEMSIARNVGAMAQHLGQIRTNSNYRKSSASISRLGKAMGPAGEAFVRFGQSAKDSLKQFVLPDTMLFEQLGIICTPPVDGHDIGALRAVFKNALSVHAPILVHVVTKKGAGYKPAEEAPSTFHGTGPYDIATGASKKKPSDVLTYTQAFSKSLMNEAARNDRVVAITAAMEGGTGLKEFAKAYPKRFFDVGIAEQHAVGLASGFAIGGAKPVVAIYSTFLQRAIDQLIINNALPDLNVVFAVDRAGLVGDDGPTHHGVFDIAYGRMIPNMNIIAPSNEKELAAALHTALELDGPFIIRYPRGNAEGSTIPDKPDVLEPGKSTVVREGNDVTILAFGRMVGQALDAADKLSAEGVEARVVDMRWVKPLDEQAVAQAAQGKLTIVVEEGVREGGIGEEVAAQFTQIEGAGELICLGLPDEFVEQGDISLLLADVGLDGDGIAATVKANL